MCIFEILKILIRKCPYITFKKILNKSKNNNYDNFQIIITVSKSRNIKVRNSYLDFISEYIKYIA